jgi:hypothetical protein
LVFIYKPKIKKTEPNPNKKNRKKTELNQKKIEPNRKNQAKQEKIKPNQNQPV